MCGMCNRSMVSSNTKTRHNQPRSPQRQHDAVARAIWIGRIGFLTCLCVVAAALGYVGYYLLSNSERQLAETQFQGIATKALQTTQANVRRMYQGKVSMASVIANMHPNVEDWPMVTIDGFEEMANNILKSSTGRAMGFSPLVTPEQVPAFEEFIINYYYNEREPPFAPNSTKTSIYQMESASESIFNNTANNNNNGASETMNGPADGSPRTLLTPLTQTSRGWHPQLLWDLHSIPVSGHLIDNVLLCTDRRQELYLQYEQELKAKNQTASSTTAPGNTNQRNPALDIECSSVSDFQDFNLPGLSGPGAILTTPVYTRKNKTQPIGFLSSTISWARILENVFNEEISGVDCVLETDLRAQTYSIVKGAAVALEDSGDYHDRNYNRLAKSISLTMDVFENITSAPYTMTLYPTEDLYAVYGSSNPVIATVGAVLVIIFTSVLFIFYDYFVRREFTAKKEMLEVKRQFMRFVSHEVRTPLNSVCMGLVLIMQEIVTALGCKHVSGNIDYDSQMIRDLDVSPMVAVENVSSEHIVEWLGLLQEVFGSARASVEVLSELLFYDKIEAGNLQLELSVINIWELIETTANEFKISAMKKKIDLQVNFDGVYSVDGKSESAIEDDVESSASSTKYAADIANTTRQRVVVGDTIRIAQCLRNTISNALKFTPEEGSITVAISIHQDIQKSPTHSEFELQDGNKVFFPTCGSVEIAVQDSGVGMSQDQLGQLFRDGIQFNATKLQAGGGTGLGLLITKGILEQHKGDISVTSKGLNKGTTCTISLPLHTCPEMDKLNEENTQDDIAKVTNVPKPTLVRECETSSMTSDSQGRRPMRILVVDDVVTNRKLLARLLTNHGHECDLAEDGQDAINKVKERMLEHSNCTCLGDDEDSDGKRQPCYYYDTILMDYEMPLLNGPEAAQKLRRMGCQTFIVGVTGNVLPEDQQHYLQCGANSILTKPFVMSRLEQLWEKHGIEPKGS